jgi:S1-C subfamily serine protease
LASVGVMAQTSVDPPSDGWAIASATGPRLVELATLRVSGPVVLYRMHYGIPAKSFVSRLHDFLVEGDCTRRTRRDALWSEGVSPTGPSASVDLLGKAFVEELEFVCNAANVAFSRPLPTTAEAGSPSAPRPPVSKPATTSGSGFAVQQNYFVTNFHVVESCTDVAVKNGREFVPAKVVAEHQAADLAILFSRTSTPAVAAIRRSAVLGESVTVAGYPLTGLLSSDIIVTSGQRAANFGAGSTWKQRWSVD